MNQDRRAAIAALGLTLPFGLTSRAAAAIGPPPVLHWQSFEAAVRDAFRSGPASVRVAIGHSAEVEAGLPGSTNDRPFAGFPTGHLRIVRSACEPGPAVGGVRLYVTIVDVAVTPGRPGGRPLDFASLPPAPVLFVPGPTS